MKRVLLHLAFAAVCANSATCFSQTNGQPFFLTGLSQPHYGSFFLAGVSNFNTRNYSAGITNFTHALALDPRDAGAWWGRATCKHRLGYYSGAVDDYSKAVQLNPKEGAYYCGRGQSKFELRDYVGALADYNQAIELDPTNAIPYFNRGQVAACAHSNFTSAIADFTKALELHNDSEEADIYFCRGNARFRLKDFSGAIADYTKTLQLNPAYHEARTNLAVAQDRLRAPEKK